MAKNQSPQRTDQEWFDIITRCRQSGLSDAKWCRLNGIPASSFSEAAKRLRNKAYAVPGSIKSVVDPLDFTSKQEVVRIDIKEDTPAVNYDEVMPDIHPVSPSSSYLDNSHTIEIHFGEAVIKLSNNANPDLVRMIASSFCFGGHGYAR